MIKTYLASAMTVIFVSSAAFAQTNQPAAPSAEKVELIKLELNKLGETKDAEYDMKGGETKKFEITVKEAGKLEIKFPIYAPMMNSAGDATAADNVVSRSQGSNVTIQKTLEWKMKKGDQEVGSGTNVVKFGQLNDRIIPSTIEHNHVMLTQAGTYLFEIKCERYITVCKDKASLTLLHPSQTPMTPANMEP